MRRTLLVVIAVTIAALAAVGPADAHPLGNFSVNHLTRIAVDRDQIRVQYVLDQAEIPTFQERDLSDAAVLARKRDEVQRRLVLLVDGHRVPLRFTSDGRLTHPPGQGGLPVTRVELALTAPAGDVRSVVVHDDTFPERIGWKAVVARLGDGTDVRSTAPSGDPTNGLHSYPRDQLKSPLDERDATLTVRRGDGALTAPRSAAGSPVTTNRAGDGFAGVFDRGAAGKGALLLLMLAAFGWGALHALSPGHGKAMVAAYLVGTRGMARHAVALGMIVTVTHTVGVFALGLVTLLLSQYLLPEQLFPWLTLVSGVLIVLIGGAVLRTRIRHARADRAGHDHDHAGHGHDHAGHGHDHGGHGHDHGGHGHSHDIPAHLTWRGLTAMGASAGIIPCPSALVVLLGAVAQHQVGLGLILIVAFSLGLAGTLTGLGLAVVWAGRLTSRVRVWGPLATGLPTASAVVILLVGVVLTARAIPNVV